MEEAMDMTYTIVHFLWNVIFTQKRARDKLSGKGRKDTQALSHSSTYLPFVYSCRFKNSMEVTCWNIFHVKTNMEVHLYFILKCDSKYFTLWQNKTPWVTWSLSAMIMVGPQYLTLIFWECYHLLSYQYIYMLQRK